MTETKEQVFNVSVEKAISMTLIAGFERPYSDKYRDDMQKRYAAAADCDTDCQWCHGERTPIKTKTADNEEFFVFTRWGDHTLDYDPPQVGQLQAVINFCPMCGRKLEGTK